MFKVAANDGKQGVPYGVTFGRGDNITAMRHSTTELEFAVNGKSQGKITLKVPLPANAVGCASMCARSGEPPAILALQSGPIPPPEQPKPDGGHVKLATCNRSNGSQNFTYDQESRSVSYQGQCLTLPQTTLGSADASKLPDATAFSSVVLGACSAALRVGVASLQRQRAGEGDLGTANSFTWSPALGYLRSIYASCNLCIGVCGEPPRSNATAV